MTVPDVAQFEQAQNFFFRDKALLLRAFIHRSYLNEITATDTASTLKDNERLEFLGDSVLGYVVSEDLYRRFPDHQEGALTSIRSALVQRDTLARLAIALRLGDYLHLGRGEEDSGGRERPATLCAAFEALVGAIYMDQGIEGVRTFVLPIMHAELERILHHALDKDAKSRLQEYVQSTMNVTPRYRPVESSGPDHAKTFVMKVMFDNKMQGVGLGRKKQDASQAAAAMALHRLEQYAPEYTPNPELEARFGFSADGNSAEPSATDEVD
jgi:ribonuclease-3